MVPLTGAISDRAADAVVTTTPSQSCCASGPMACGVFRRNARVAALVEASPHLDADQLMSAFELCGETGEHVHPYTAAERKAHDLIGAWLAHTGARHNSGDPDLLPQTESSRAVFVRAADVYRGLVDSDGQPEAVLPLLVLIELLEDLVTHLALPVAPIERHHDYAHHRLTMDAAHRAYHHQP